MTSVQTLPVIFVTPDARDGAIANAVLAEAGISGRVCPTLDELSRLPAETVGCAVLVEEALTAAELEQFRQTLAAQPPWSDLPLVLIATQGAALGALIDRVFPDAGNVAVLERPMNRVSLISAVQVGLRSRHRQLEVRDLLEQRSNALQQRDEFLAMLSHELRNPLAPLRNATYVLKHLPIENEVFAKTRELMERQVKHLARLVDDLLDVSRLELGKIQLQRVELDLNAAMTAAAEACQPMIGKRQHTLELKPAATPLRVSADPVRIEQVIGNLITNAAKFTPDGGTICMEGGVSGHYATVVIRDSGIGIDADMLSNVFDLFSQDARTLARSQGGLGIGLTIVKRLIELHGGNIEVYSKGRDQGAQFTVRLPLLRLPERSQPIQNDLSAPAGARRVLVIEDNPDIRSTLGMLLEMWGHGVDYAVSGTDGVSCAERLKPDVALIDIGLPGLTGYEVARRIRAFGLPWARSVKLVALTGYGRESDREEALASGFDCHLVKPVDPDILAQVLR